ncbi:MAG: hypothetical protein IJ422_04515 [Oscillospiraceae bacterium]|nr:hypothetical protein [Oscillospiraceae bacterium]
MNGIFLRKRGWSILSLASGLFLVALFLFLKHVDGEAGPELWAGVSFGAAICVVSFVSLCFNLGAFLRPEDGRLSARYHWFGKLDCDLHDIAFVLPQLNTLTILLKNGRRHVITGIENGWSISEFLRRQLFTMETASPDTLSEELDRLMARRKKELRYAAGGVAAMFIWIFITVLLTGGRDLHEFGKPDWIIFGVMGGLELLTLVGTFYAAQLCGKKLLSIEHLKYRLQGAVIATQPLPSGNVKQVYTDESHTGRLCVCGFPDDPGVYYCVEGFAGGFRLETLDTSRIYPSLEDFPVNALENLIDITQWFQ